MQVHQNGQVKFEYQGHRLKVKVTAVKSMCICVHCSRLKGILFRLSWRLDHLFRLVFGLAAKRQHS